MSETKRVTCIICAVGCPVEVDYEGTEILAVRNCGEPICDSGKRGLEYARREFINPVRTLTTTLRVQNGSAPLVPVKTTAPVPRVLLQQCMRALAPVKVDAPIEMGDALVKDILGTGADIIATASVPEKS